MHLDRTQSVAWPQRCCLLRRLHLREHDPTPDNPSESPSHPSFIISFSHPYHHPTHLSCNPQVCRWLVYSSPLYFSFSPSFLGRGMAGLFPTLFRVQGLYEATALPALLSCGSCQHSGMSLKPESLQSSALSPCSDDQWAEGMYVASWQLQLCEQTVRFCGLVQIISFYVLCLLI